jgi:hypothetical protein
LCANLADPAPANAARGRSPTAAGMSAGHGPSPVARGCDAALVTTPSLLAGHGPLRATRDHGLATVVTLSLSNGHEPLRATRGYAPLLVCQPSTHHLFFKCTFEGNVYLHTHISLPLELCVVFLLHKLQLDRNCQALSRKYHNVLTFTFSLSWSQLSVVNVVYVTVGRATFLVSALLLLPLVVVTVDTILHIISYRVSSGE